MRGSRYGFCQCKALLLGPKATKEQRRCGSKRGGAEVEAMRELRAVKHKVPKP